VLELMKAGLPIVAYAVGELIPTVGDAGVLVEPGDDTAFSRAVVALLSDSELALRLGAMARARILDRFTWEHLSTFASAAYRVAGTAPGGFGEPGDTQEGPDATRKTTAN
jgi:glycosyltransferase involved in cell wall biosynthesis